MYWILRSLFLTCKMQNAACICVFQTSSRFRCESDADCQKHFGSVLANGERQLWFQPFNCPEGYRLTHNHHSWVSATQVLLRGCASHLLAPPMKPRAGVRSRAGVRLSRKASRCKRRSSRSGMNLRLSSSPLSSHPFQRSHAGCEQLHHLHQEQHSFPALQRRQVGPSSKAASFLILKPTVSLSEGTFPPP